MLATGKPRQTERPKPPTQEQIRRQPGRKAWVPNQHGAWSMLVLPPIVGWVADHLGPRWALGVGAASGFAAALVALGMLARANAAARHGTEHGSMPPAE